jgi:hypothetical protein
MPAVQRIERAIPNLNAPLYREFIAANPAYFATVGRRVVSYWNEYHRRQFPKLEQYPGWKAHATLGRAQ